MNIAACRPVDLDPSDPVDAKILEMTFVYDGSVQAACRRCGRAVWVGPKQQERLAADPSIIIGCFPCAAAPEGQLAASLGLLTVSNLGNPETPPERVREAQKKSALADVEARCLVCDLPCPGPDRKMIVAYNAEIELWDLAGFIHSTCDDREDDHE